MQRNSPSAMKTALSFKVYIEGHIIFNWLGVKYEKQYYLEMKFILILDLDHRGCSLFLGVLGKR